MTNSEHTDKADDEKRKSKSQRKDQAKQSGNRPNQARPVHATTKLSEQRKSELTNRKHSRGEATGRTRQMNGAEKREPRAGRNDETKAIQVQAIRKPGEGKLASRRAAHFEEDKQLLRQEKEVQLKQRLTERAEKSKAFEAQRSASSKELVKKNTGLDVKRGLGPGPKPKDGDYSFKYTAGQSALSAGSRGATLTGAKPMGLTASFNATLGLNKMPASKVVGGIADFFTKFVDFTKPTKGDSLMSGPKGKTVQKTVPAAKSSDGKARNDADGTKLMNKLMGRKNKEDDVETRSK